MLTPDEESAYKNGSRAAWLMMLRECVKQLGYGAAESSYAAWIIERSEAIQTLRQLCAAHGDNDWPDTLHLGDVIDKHLWRHLG
jgi:hypothetical protein